MLTSEILRVRVDKATAKRVQAWARAHDTDISGALRKALERLLAEEERAKRIAAAKHTFQEMVDAGFLDPPNDENWKVGGFK